MCVKSRKLVFIANSDRLSAASSGLGFDIRLMELHWATFACGSISQSIVYRSNFSKLIHFVSKSPTTHIHHCNITPKTRGAPGFRRSSWSQPSSAEKHLSDILTKHM
jgi:hypothetical protein